MLELKASEITDQTEVGNRFQVVAKQAGVCVLRMLAIFILIIGAALSTVAAQQTGPVGQSSTLLADGQVLQAGGFDSRSIPSNGAFITSDGKRTKIVARMNIARSGHTATMLPDGTVFIFGGVGIDGKIVKTAERFDPAAGIFSIVPDVFAVPRAFHTATVMTDGTILFAGGVLEGGEFPDDVQLFDYRTNKALSFHALLVTTREGHSADLLSDGTVRISGGTDPFGRPAVGREIYDPLAKRFRFSADSANGADTDQLTSFRIAATLPEDGAIDVPIQDPISIRFTRLVNYSTVNGKNFVLTRPDGVEIQTKVTPAESGRLAFILPITPLQPGSSYTLTIKGCMDKSADSLPESSITFQTAGAPPDGAGPDYVPGPGWTMGTGNSKWQELPALQAPSGTTAVAGQVLKLNGWPLEHATVEIDGQKARTDATGRFLLKNLVPGHHVLWIDASTANHAGATYGTYEVGVTVLANKTNVLNYTIWMTRLDMAHATNIPSPTAQETILTNPSLPGLELHLPPHTTITDRNGRVVRQISITPVPLDKPPFPLPAGVDVPIYFTVQPGGAYIKVATSSIGPKGAQLIYPNGFNLKPGTPFDFWNYDADARGWYIYGGGKVSDSGSNIIPDPGVVIYEFTGAMVGNTSGRPGIGTPDGPSSKAADPVDLSTGQFIYTKTDLTLPDTIPINFSRTYITNDSRSRAFGIGATDSYDFFMVGNTFPYTFQELIKPDGGRVRFDRISPGTSYTDSIYVASTSAGSLYGAVLSRNTDPSLPGTWKITLKDGTILSFPEAPNFINPFCQAVLQIRDRYGNTTKIDRSAQCTLAKITSPNGRYITVSNDSQNRITSLTDNSGRTVSYTYDAAGRLSTVTDAGNGVTTYTYDDQNRMLTIRDARGILYLTNQYDGGGRVSQQTAADGGIFLFNWTLAQPSQTHFIASVGPTDNGGVGGTIFRDACWGSGGFKRYDSTCGAGYMPLVAQVDVTDPRGYVERVVFGPTGYKTSDTRALGQPEQQTATFSYYSDNLLKSVTDSLGRVTSFDYDGQGNTTRITRLDGTPDAVTTIMSYGALSEISSVTDPLNHTTTFNYDLLGNLTSVVDSLNHPTSFTYNSDGRISSISDILSNSVQFGYLGGDLVSVTDPLGNISTSFYDPAGRVISATDVQGNTVKTQYSPLNLVTQVTDAKGNSTQFSYDPNGNVLSLTDALNHTTNYTYDNMDRLQMRTDPLLRQESYSYDLNGNLVSSTDRKSQVTSLTYDPLNRLKLVGYNTVVNAGVISYESTVGYTYDAGNRMTQAVDSAGETITEAYDNLDRLTSETTCSTGAPACGLISYGYDLAGRRASMTVAGQPQVTYTYDNANRLTQITQGTSTVGFSYDTINRRSTLTLSNGVNMSYTYDNDSRVTGITYKFNANTLGNLTYTYDSLGRRTQVGGSFAQTGLPGSITSATYDAANELTNWNGTPISYDLNGNMLSDGTNTFSWNARNQVATLNSISLQYDAFGRRTKNLQNTSFLFDGANAVQELSGSTAIANLISGSIDEIFNRADSTGTHTPLQDALGSTIALIDASGNLVTQYAYDPFGSTTVSGAASSNVFQYTGRENEGNGLYFYRARYYSPLLGRFINQDPIGLRGGVNIYAYAENNPISRIDPFGLDWLNNLADFSAGAGSVLSFGLTDVINDATGASSVVNKCSGWHTAGTVSGFVLATAIGGAGGLEEGLEKEAGEEWSHWIPDRLKQSAPNGKGWLPDFIVDSDLNGQYTSIVEHALNDPSRYRFMSQAWKAANPMNPEWLQQLNRIPPWVTGAAAGAAYGGASSALAGRSCSCH